MAKKDLDIAEPLEIIADYIIQINRINADGTFDILNAFPVDAIRSLKIINVIGSSFQLIINLTDNDEDNVTISSLGTELAEINLQRIVNAMVINRNKLKRAR